jgi:hypothetical protein
LPRPGAALAYLLDARRVSLHPHNLLFLQPTALLVLVLWAHRGRLPARRRSGEAPAEGWPERVKVLALVGMFGLFILGLERIGYDIAAWAFVTAALALGGERRPLMLALFPAAFVAAVILAFKAMIPYPLANRLPRRACRRIMRTGPQDPRRPHARLPPDADRRRPAPLCRARPRHQ